MEVILEQFGERGGGGLYKISKGLSPALNGPARDCPIAKPAENTHQRFWGVFNTQDQIVQDCINKPW